MEMFPRNVRWLIMVCTALHPRRYNFTSTVLRDKHSQPWTANISLSISCAWAFYPWQKRTTERCSSVVHSQALRHLDYWTQPLNMHMRVWYLDCHEAGLCCYLVINLENLLRQLQLFYLHLDRFCDLVVRVRGYRSRGPGFDSQRYQIFWKVVGVERGSLSLVLIIVELLEWKVAVPGLPLRWPRDTLYPQKLVVTSLTSGGRSVCFACGLKLRSLVLVYFHLCLIYWLSHVLNMQMKYFVC
jgi:hypothetical protein